MPSSSSDPSASEPDLPNSSSSDSDSSDNIAVQRNDLMSSDSDSSDSNSPDSDSSDSSMSDTFISRAQRNGGSRGPRQLQSLRRNQLSQQRRSPTVTLISRDDSDDSGSEDTSNALVRYSRTDDPIVMQLKDKINDLQSQLRQMGTTAETLRHDYEQRCSASLQSAIAGLLTLAETVSKADKQIVFWYEKGKFLKVVLRPLGINKKTSVIVERKTTKLKDQVASVESQFASTSLVCKEALTEVQTLNRRVNEYSQSGIGAAQDKLVQVLSTFDEKKRNIESDIREKEIECRRVGANIDETNDGIDRTNRERYRSSEGRDNATVASIFSFGGAIGLGVVSIFCPPVAIAAGAAALLGTGTTVAAVSLNDEVNALAGVQNQLSSQLSGLEREIRSLRAQLPALERQKTSFADTSRSVKALETACLEMRQSATALSSLLLKDRQLLSHASMRTERIASDLRSVEYTSTRRQITGRLLEILQDLGHVGATGIENARALRKTISMVRQIESQTPKMLMILEKATQQSWRGEGR